MSGPYWRPCRANQVFSRMFSIYTTAEEPQKTATAFRSDFLPSSVSMHASKQLRPKARTPVNSSGSLLSCRPADHTGDSQERCRKLAGLLDPQNSQFKRAREPISRARLLSSRGAPFIHPRAALRQVPPGHGTTSDRHIPKVSRLEKREFTSKPDR